MTKQGMRAVAIAKKTYKTRPDSLAEDKLEDMEFVAIVGFEDAVREETAAAIKATQQAGIDVYMLTGDHLNTARNIAQRVGLIETGAQALEGKAIEGHTIEKIYGLLQKVRVFARVLPEHKYNILKALKRTEIAAMTGDGVNDSPALSQADVGIAMGSGTDAAKEAADLVLLDDNYSTIVAAIEEGRTIYANIRKMVFYLLSTNLAEIMTIIFSLLLGLPLPVTAAQILWLNIVTDSTMVIPVGLEPPEDKQMQKPPRHPKESLLSNHLLSRLIITGLVMSLSSLFMFWLFLPEGIMIAQTMGFFSLIVVQWANAFTTRSETESIAVSMRRPNRYLWYGLGLGIVLQFLIIFTPLSGFMGIALPPLSYLPLLFLPIMLTILSGEIHKNYFRNKKIN